MGLFENRTVIRLLWRLLGAEIQPCLPLVGSWSLCCNLADLWHHFFLAQLFPGCGALIYQSYDGISQIASSWILQYILVETASRRYISVIDSLILNCHTLSHRAAVSFPDAWSYIYAVCYEKKKKRLFYLQISKVVKLRKNKRGFKNMSIFYFSSEKPGISLCCRRTKLLPHSEIFSFAPVVQRQKLSQKRERKPESTFTNRTTGSSASCKMITVQGIVLCDNMSYCLCWQLFFRGSTKAALQFGQGYFVWKFHKACSNRGESYAFLGVSSGRVL